MFINILFSVILTLIFILIYHFKSYCIYLCNCIISYDRILFGLSCNMLFLTLQPALYWLYAAPYQYIRILEHILYITAYQWFFSINYNSIYIIDLYTGNNSLITATSSYFICYNGRYRISTSSSNSLHSFGISNIGIKLDCLPARYLSIPLIINKCCLLGRCYELCGTFHHSMIFSLIII